MGRVTASSQQTAGHVYSMSYDYDLAGNLTREIYPTGRVITHTYDPAGRLASVAGQKANQSATLYVSQVSYTAHGAVASQKLGNSTAGQERWEHTLFNSRLQPVEIGLGSTVTSAELLKLSYQYGEIVNGTLEQTRNNGNVQSQTITVPGLAQPLVQTYEYDALNRLSVARETNSGVQSWQQVYGYDRFGNRSFGSGTTMPAVLDYQTNPAINPNNNRYSDTAHYSYDAAGNVTASGGNIYDFDAENHIATVEDGNPNPIRYVYDGDGHRVEKVTANGQETTVFVYDALGQMVAEYNNLTPATTNETSYLTSDTLGTPRVVTKADGSVKERHDYLPFGEELFAGTGGRTGSTQQAYPAADEQQSVRQKFTGYERDIETNLDYAQARYYTSAQGRFTSIDPLLASGRAVNPKTWNRYTYALNNPLRFVDPEGLDPQDTREDILGRIRERQQNQPIETTQTPIATEVQQRPLARAYDIQSQGISVFRGTFPESKDRFGNVLDVSGQPADNENGNSSVAPFGFNLSIDYTVTSGGQPAEGVAITETVTGTATVLVPENGQLVERQVPVGFGGSISGGTTDRNGRVTDEPIGISSQLPVISVNLTQNIYATDASGFTQRLVTNEISGTTSYRMSGDTVTGVGPTRVMYNKQTLTLKPPTNIRIPQR
jgi:RHS repeat-associated protein